MEINDLVAALQGDGRYLITRFTGKRLEPIADDAGPHDEAATLRRLDALRASGDTYIQTGHDQFRLIQP